ncbi:lipopolysaccharide biosynthesis protein [Leifsonia shinshuensis]|uniref:lipopolysaccharide biosynthesis protein n=1 Tax=Leifsonia shinshuensis TaxID=150026 RepID=UPI00285F42E3|nr:lipopolysaccharide biosynthesis protein [Leifsonia shinshuensis]MDR6971745.1 PST family polysaccharide transporter [Leifsonia shinshuensis]
MTIRTPRPGPQHRVERAGSRARTAHDPDAPDVRTPAPGTEGLGRRAARGAAVTLGAQGGKVVVQVASVVVLARLLSPHDYGLIAMVVAIIGVGELFRDFGLSSASIQAPVVTRGQRSNLFWVNAAIGAVLTAAVFSGAGLIALGFHQPDLVPIAHALAFTFLINGLGTQYRADLVRRMRFNAVALADIVAPFLALGVAVGSALAGWGYWALVAQQLTQATVLLVVLVISGRWLPGLPRRDAPIGAFVAFGWNMLASQLVSYISNNIDNILVGARFGASALGVYSRAFQLLMTPLNQVRIPLTTVALPVFSRLQDDKERFGEWLCRGQLALGYTVVAGLALVAGASEPLTSLLLGAQWGEAAPILRLFAIAGIFQILAFVGYWAYVSRGLTGALLRYSLVSAAIKIVCIVIGSFGGVLGVAIAYAIAPALSWPLSLWWLARNTEVPTARLYAGAGRVLACAAFGAAAAWAACTTAAALGTVVQVAAAVVALALVYGAAVLLIPAIRRDLSGVMAAARMVRSR